MGADQAIDHADAGQRDGDDGEQQQQRQRRQRQGGAPDGDAGEGGHAEQEPDERPAQRPPRRADVDARGRDYRDAPVQLDLARRVLSGDNLTHTLMVAPPPR
ncbi:MAG: hypothetical protein U0531_20835 [Dehalococcoidia bacterium]